MKRELDIPETDDFSYLVLCTAVYHELGPFDVVVYAVLIKGNGNLVAVAATGKGG